MHHVTHIRDAAIAFLLLGLLLKTFVPRRKPAPEPPFDNSWYAFVRNRIKHYLMFDAGHALGSFFLHCGIFLMILAML
jgi:hypothetical protein